METSDIIASFSLFVSIIVIPVSHYLGGCNARYSAYNATIDELENLCQKILNESLTIHKESDYSETNYHLMIANHKLLQSKCCNLNYLINQSYPSRELRDIKKIITDQLFSEQQEQRDTAIRNLIYKLTPLIEFYPKKFN